MLMGITKQLICTSVRFGLSLLTDKKVISDKLRDFHGHSRSLVLLSFHQPHMNSSWSAVVTVHLSSSSISKILLHLIYYGNVKRLCYLNTLFFG